MGRIQKRKTNFLQIIIFGLQRAAGPYRAKSGLMHRSKMARYAVPAIIIFLSVAPALGPFPRNQTSADDARSQWCHYLQLDWGR